MLLSSGGLDRMSMRSRSPDDNSSLISASSLDSALNHSREEDEIRALTMEPYLVEEPKEVDSRESKKDILFVLLNNYKYCLYVLNLHF